VSDVDLAANSTAFTVVHDNGSQRETFPVRLPIGGAFQVGNALAAIGATLRLGVPRKTIVAGLESLPPVPGRFESVPTGARDFHVIVDYAHTPDGLENVLQAARKLNPGRIVVVFGCGGNRDRTKRPIMGRLAATLAEVAIVTSDNPRHENPAAIIAEILPGTEVSTEPKAEVHVEPDRRAAIALALRLAQPNDLILIAGKGHEDYQIIGDTVLPFDDREVVRALLAATPERAE
jgi:UDP-N-acetylmuramoyl-L-alanyl-D-glutamate--2,6-diaminopimelate ligase